jgi:ABC-2 type transport system permease protein
MFSALIYLQTHSMRNRLLRRLRRLKNPRYLIGAVIGLAYFAFYILQFSFLRRGGPSFFGTGSLGFGEYLGALVLLLPVASAWLFPSDRASLAFTEAEVAFLFPAPITRRGLIQYKILRSQTAIFFTTLLLTLITGRWRYASHVWIAILGWWIILSTLNLYQLAVSFARSKLLDRGLTSARRRVLVITLLAAGVGAVLYFGWNDLPALPAKNPDPAALFDWLRQALATGPARYVLYPLRLVVRPYYAPDTGAFFLALGPALALFALLYAWVMRADVAFEEASIEFSQKVAERIATVRARQIPGGIRSTKAARAPFALAPGGPPAIAFLWKNLILASQTFSWRTWLRFAPLLIVIAVIATQSSHGSPGPPVVGFFCIMLLFMSVFMGPNLARFDFAPTWRSLSCSSYTRCPGGRSCWGKF